MKAATKKSEKEVEEIHTNPPTFSNTQMFIEAEKIVEQLIQQRIAVQLSDVTQKYEQQFAAQTSYYETRITELENYVRYLSKLLMESSQMCWSLYNQSQQSNFKKIEIGDWTQRFQYPEKKSLKTWNERIKI